MKRPEPELPEVDGFALTRTSAGTIFVTVVLIALILTLFLDKGGGTARDASPDSGPASTATLPQPTDQPPRADRAELPSEHTTPRSAPRTAKKTLGAKLIITARCVDPEGTPIEGAMMTAHDVQGDPSSTSGPDGVVRLELTWPPKRTWGNNRWAMVRFTAPARSTVHRQEAIEGPETVALGDVELRAGGSIIGDVRDTDGIPVAGATVWPVRGVARTTGKAEERRIVRGAFQSARSTQSMTTQADGTYRMEGVATGSISMVAKVRGHYLCYTNPVEVRAGGTTRAPTLVIRKLRDENAIRGVVVDHTNTPIHGAEVQVFPNRGARNVEQITSTRTLRDGRFELRVLSDTKYSVQVDSRNTERSTVRHDVAAGTTDAIFRFGERRHMQVTVTDLAGAAIEKPVLTLSSTQGVGLRHKRPEPIDGGLRVVVPDQPFHIGIGGKGYRFRQFGPYEPETAPAELDAKLEHLPTVRGRVVAEGRGVPGAKVHLHALPRRDMLVRYTPAGALYGRLEAGRQRVVETDDSGRFTLPFYRAQRVVVHAIADGFARAQSAVIDLKSPPDGEITLPMVRGGTIAGEVLVAEGQRAEGTMVAATDGDGHVATQLVGADGQFSLSDLAAGDWQVVRIAGADRRYLRSMRSWPSPGIRELPRHVTVVAGRTTRFDLDFRVTPTATLDGVLVLDGKPAAGFGVRLLVATRAVTTQTNAAGRFKLRTSPSKRAGLVFQRRTADDATLSISLGLPLDEGPHTKRFAFATGSIELADLPQIASATYELRSKPKGHERCSSNLRFLPDAKGRFRADRLPVGPAKLYRGKDGRYEELGELMIRTGQRTTFRLPKR